MGETRKPPEAISMNCASSSAMPPPLPPSVKAGRIITGYPILLATAIAVSMSSAMSEGMTGSFISASVSLKRSLSSALSIVSGSAPSSVTFIFSKKPSLASCMERVSPVCPPSVESRLSGRSFSIILLTVVRVSGSIYILSATALSVMMVAGLELTSTTSSPSSLSARHACVPA